MRGHECTSTELWRIASGLARARHRALCADHVFPVLGTHEDVEDRHAWGVDESVAVESVLDALDEHDPHDDVRKFAEQFLTTLVRAARADDRDIRTGEVLNHHSVNRNLVTQTEFDDLTRFFANEVVGLDAPERCYHITWADGDASWVYRPAQGDVEDREVAHV